MKKDNEETKITTEEFKNHFMKVSEERFENDPQDIEETVDLVEDLRENEKAKEWKERLNKPPEKKEVVEQMQQMRDSAPGEDGVRMNYLSKGVDKVIDEITRIVAFMFVEPADKWEESLRTGVVVPLYKKKGDKDNPNNFRGVCLLSLGSQILARIIAVRLFLWAEEMELLDDDQQGFRKVRSTADATQVMVRLKEDAEDLEIRKGDGQMEEEDQLEARLLDLRKAYPR